MYYLAFFLVLIAGGFATSVSSIWPVYHSNYTSSTPAYYTVDPSSSSSSATTTPPPPPNNSSVTLKEPEAVTTVAPAAIPGNNTALGVTPRNGHNVPDITVDPSSSSSSAEIFPLISWINYLTWLSAGASNFVMRIVTALLALTTFTSLLCSYTSHCWAAIQGLQVKEVVLTQYKTIHSVLRTMENIFVRSNTTHDITIDDEQHTYSL